MRRPRSRLAAEAPPAATDPAGPGRLWHNRNGRVGLLIVGLLPVVAALAAAGIAPHPPRAQHPADAFTAPSARYWLGTDQFGRDVASRVMEGVFASLRVAVLAVAVATLIGAPPGSPRAPQVGGPTGSSAGSPRD